MAGEIDNIHIIQEFYNASIRKDVDDAYKRDMLKAIF